MDLNQHSKLLHCQPAKLFEHDLTAVAALHEAIHASVPQLEAPGFMKAIERQQAAAAALHEAIHASVPQLEAPGFTKAIERQQAAAAALHEAIHASVPQLEAPGFTKAIERQQAAAAALRKAIHASVPQLEAPGFMKAIKRQQAVAAALRKAIIPPSVPQLEAPGFMKAIERQQAAVAALRKTIIPPSVPQLEAPGFMKAIERQQAAAATLRKAIVPSSVSQLEAPGFMKAIERQQAAAAALCKAMVLPSVPQLEAPVDKPSKTLDRMRSPASPIHRSDMLPNNLLMPPEFGVYAWEKEWNQYSEEPDCCVPIKSTTDSTVSGEYLAGEIRRSGLPKVKNVIRVLKHSEKNFRDGDFNGCLNNARVVLETVARLIAQARHSNHAGNFNSAKWGEVIAYLRKSKFITKERECELADVFRFISPGSHFPVEDEEFARSGRTRAVSICYFLVKQFNAADTES